MSQLSILLLSMALDFGGAETHVISLAKALQRTGLRVLVASNGGRLVPELEAAGIKHYPVALHARNPLALLRSIDIIKRIVQSEDVRLMHAHARIPAWVAQRVGRATGVPLVTTYHGCYSAHWFLRLFTTGGQQTIAVAPDVKDYLIERFNFPPEQITVIHNGIDTEQFAVAEYPPPNRQQVTYISRMSGERGGVALSLLEAVALLHDDFPALRVVIVGDGDRLPEVQALASRLNEEWGGEYCQVLGGRADIPQLLAQAGIVVGVGRVALEAMSTGRPVIVANEYGCYGLLEAATLQLAMQHNFSGRGATQETNPVTIANALREVLLDPERADRAVQVAREAVETHYSVTEKAREVLNVYSKLVPELAKREEGDNDDR
ncbi:MAG: glycosyltransferase family 4 protein [Firmicutes bacterium]|nr:glycosyltransferase family 4 protein [Bacillota bacterium]